MNQIKSGVFVLTEVPDPGDHVPYNWWHSSDHIPENRAIDGIVVGVRWAAPQSLMDARLVVHPGFAAHQYVQHYMMTEPIERVWREFMDLGVWSREADRTFPRRRLLFAGHYRLLGARCSTRIPISPEALPFRPYRGVFIVMADVVEPATEAEAIRWYEEIRIPDMLSLEGILGVYWFRCREAAFQQNVGMGGESAAWWRADNEHVHHVSTAQQPVVGDPLHRYVFLYYLDADPLEMAGRIREGEAVWDAAGRSVDESRTLRRVLAAPYEQIEDPRHYDWPNR
jgi:hypothetical protein